MIKPVTNKDFVSHAQNDLYDENNYVIDISFYWMMFPIYRIDDKCKRPCSKVLCSSIGVVQFKYLFLH